MSKNTKIKNPKVMKRSIFTIVFSVILIGLIIFNVFSGVVKINKTDPHSYKIVKSIYLKEGEKYEYK